MKFVGIKDLRYNPMKIINGLSTENEVIVTMNGRPRALLTPISDTQIEQFIKAFRQAKAALAVAMLQSESIANKTDKLTNVVIRSEIKAIRKARRSK